MATTAQNTAQTTRKNTVRQPQTINNANLVNNVNRATNVNTVNRANPVNSVNQTNSAATTKITAGTNNNIATPEDQNDAISEAIGQDKVTANIQNVRRTSMYKTVLINED